MAFLMLLHEKMRLQRRQNKLTLKQLRMGNKLDRIKKNIEKKQKYYSKLEKNLENQANMFKNAAKMQISSMFGLGQNSFNPQNLYGFSAAAVNIASQWTTNPLNNSQELSNEDKKSVLALMQGYYLPEKDEKGTVTGYKINGTFEGAALTLKPEDYQRLQQIAGAANNQVASMQMQCQQFQTNYENNISIWLEAQKEQLAAEQDCVLDALSEEENDMEMEKTSIETELELIKERKQALEQALAEGIKDSAPKFGLG